MPTCRSPAPPRRRRTARAGRLSPPQSATLQRRPQRRRRRPHPSRARPRRRRPSARLRRRCAAGAARALHARGRAGRRCSLTASSAATERPAVADPAPAVPRPPVDLELARGRDRNRRGRGRTHRDPPSSGSGLMNVPRRTAGRRQHTSHPRPAAAQRARRARCAALRYILRRSGACAAARPRARALRPPRTGRRRSLRSPWSLPWRSA